VKRFLLWLIDYYQRNISPVVPPTCKYTPTCSNYAKEAVETHGALRGSLLAMWRILRCNPFSRGGFDPVPPPRGGKPDRGGTDDDVTRFAGN
jgi:putative membrane protein insertion efficiency factor